MDLKVFHNITTNSKNATSSKLDQPLYQYGGSNEIFILTENGTRTEKNENTIKNELYQTIKENLYLIPFNIGKQTNHEVSDDDYEYDKKYNIAMIETAITELDYIKPIDINIHNIYVDRIMYNFDILNEQNVDNIIKTDIVEFCKLVCNNPKLNLFFKFDTLNYDSILKILVNNLITKHKNHSFYNSWNRFNKWYNRFFNNDATVMIENMDMTNIVLKMFGDVFQRQSKRQNFITKINSTYKKTIFTEENLRNELHSIFNYIREYVKKLNKCNLIIIDTSELNKKEQVEKIIVILKLSFELETAFNEIYRERNTDSPMVLRRKDILTDIIVGYNELEGIDRISGGRHTRKNRKLSKQKTIRRIKKVKKSINIHTRRRRKDRKNTTKHRN